MKQRTDQQICRPEQRPETEADMRSADFLGGTKVTQKRRDGLFHARLGSGGSWVNQVPRTRSFGPDQTPIRAQNGMGLRVKPRRQILVTLVGGRSP